MLAMLLLPALWVLGELLCCFQTKGATSGFLALLRDSGYVYYVTASSLRHLGTTGAYW